ncbi:HAMP domain-containing sensor histidine kinase [Bacillus sp. FJAT-27251]|uniref:HAMP domain-containing sensor histidine kinase n=1 Tax=Bacillus sp. FJAT-27251 TaxID=1684142 RepID=UPI0006A7AF10|nr:HAMP domain-containing sensor histidine kinase [Bacillus sp. FJAT-27251]
MKWKITAQFLLFMSLSLLISFFLFLVLNFVFLYSNLAQQDRIFPYQNPGSYTLGFAGNIGFDNGEISIPAEELQELRKADIWIQVLDENGSEVYSRFKPENVPAKYTPAQLVQFYKYTGALEHSTIFVGMLDEGDRQLSYIMGFPEQVIGKTILHYRTETLIRDGLLVIGIVIISVTLIALLIGYFFSKRLAKPLVQIIEGIQSLSRGHFQHAFQAKGIYKSVFQNLNHLASALQSSEIERRKMEKTREEWVANISHDIKTPLASIKGYAELLQEYELEKAEKERYFDIIQDKSHYIERLIDDLNLTYRLKSTSFPLKKKQADLVEVVREAVIQVLNHPSFEEVNLQFSSKLERQPYCCDVELLQRAVMNLIFNAIVHNPPGTDISVKIQSAGNLVSIIIEDNGKGIAPDDITKLFTRYYRGTNTGKTHKGSGLGLAIAKQVTEAHGGSITVESEIDQGTRISLSLPLKS